MKPRLHQMFGIASLTVVATVFALTFLLIGSPMHRRSERLDAQRLENLKSIRSEIRLECMQGNSRGEYVLRAPLPTSLEELSNKARRNALLTRDPVTKQPYGYRVIDGTKYELEATFETARNVDYEVFWNHPAGKHIFTIDAALQDE